MSLQLQVIICSTRPGRVGPTVAGWFQQQAAQHGGFSSQLIDLADYNLPLYNEPKHPMAQQYEHAATKQWSASVAKADAYVFVLPEYNFFPPPSFVNAVDLLFKEWNYKPCSFVSYGGASGGLRSVQVAKQLVTTVKMMPIPEQVMVQGVANLVKDGSFQAQDPHLQSAKTALDELHKWATALKSIRD
ncbi:NADPH-dependent FMN reductase [Pseudidiomarina mangrovi]|uniref:NADPH-dependent FMN reductase n=1 Tax=Pseudidiomarina mangrovi TaxID=2487133 RepID=UPI000FCBB2A8|nr:NAD(P)H-dependent oxidoreductase [Pseudidiomarina mangrovi]CAI8152719.1 MAG: FMN-dependent NADPH-azoreductase [Pseudidiomarina mangrovi]